MTAEMVVQLSTHHSAWWSRDGSGQRRLRLLGDGRQRDDRASIARFNGGRRRIAPVVTALAIFVCCGGVPVLNYIPIAALVGIMMIVVRCAPRPSPLPRRSRRHTPLYRVLHTFLGSVPMLIAVRLPMVAREAATLQFPSSG